MAPLNDAVIMAVPAALAVTVNVTLDAPDGTMTGVWTVATVVLLLDSEMLEPPVGAGDVRLTVPCTVLPAETTDELKTTPDMASDVVG